MIASLGFDGAHGAAVRHIDDAQLLEPMADGRSIFNELNHLLDALAANARPCWAPVFTHDIRVGA